MTTGTSTEQRATVTLLTPEQVSDQLGQDEQGRTMLSPFTIRRLVRSGKVHCTRLARGRVTFTPAQVERMLEQLAENPVSPRRKPQAGASSPFTPSARSAASQGRG